MDFDKGYALRRQTQRDEENSFFMSQLAAEAEAASTAGARTESEVPVFGNTQGVPPGRGTKPEQTKPVGKNQGPEQIMQALDAPGSAVRSMILTSLGKGGPDSNDILNLPADEFLQKLGFDKEALAASPIMAAIAATGLGIATDPLNVVGPGGKKEAVKGAAVAADAVAEAGKDFVTKTLPKLNPLSLSPQYKVEGLKQFPVDELKLAQGSHVGDVDPKKVESLAKKMVENPDKVPALSGEQLADGSIAITDGRHRLEAAKQAGFKTVTVEVAVPKAQKDAVVNLQKIKTTDDVADAADKLAAGRGGNPPGGPPRPPAPPGGEEPPAGKGNFNVGQKPIPDAVVRDVAASLGLTPEQLLERQRGMGLDVEHMDAYNQLLGESLANIKDTAAAFKARKITADELYKSLARFQLVANAHEYAGTEAAQALRIRQRPEIKTARSFGESLTEQLAAHKGTASDPAVKTARNVGDSLTEQLSAIKGAVLDPDVLADMVEKAGAAAVAKTARDVAEIGAGDMFKELLYFNMLSNPRTNVVNVFGGAMGTPAWAIGQRFLQEKFGAGYIKSGETSAMIAAFGQAYNNAIRSVFESAANKGWWATIRSAKDAPGFGEKAARGPAITGENVGRVVGSAASAPIPYTPNLVVGRFVDPKTVDMTVRRMFGETLLGRAVDGIGELVHFPSAMLRAGDSFARAVNFDMEARALALRHGFLFGTEQSENQIIAGVNEALQAPGLMVREKAEHFAAVQTFTKELVHGVPGILNTPVAKVFVPFYQTPVNIFKYNLSHTPFAPVLREVRQELAAGGLQGEAALTRIAMGSGFMAGVAGLSMGGVIHITGRGPDNPNTRAAWLRDNQPYSIRISLPNGDKKWVSLSKIEPFGTWFGVSADMANMSGDVDPETSGEMAAAFAASFSRNFTNKTFAYSAFELLDLLNVKNYEDAEALDERILRWSANKLGGLTVPAIAGGVARGADPVYREVARHGEWATQYLDKVKSRVPGWSKDLPYVPDSIDGEPIVTESGYGSALLSPFSIKQTTDDPLVKEIVRVKTNYAHPKASLQGVDLTPEQHHDLMIAFTKSDYGEGTLRQELQKLVDSDGYKYEDAEKTIPTTDRMKAFQLELVVRARRSAAEAEFMAAHPDVFEAVYGKKLKPIEALSNPQGLTFGGKVIQEP